MSESAGRVLMIPKGTYSPTTTYDPLDVVKYEHNSYVCKQTSRGNLPTNTTYWQPLTDVTADENPTEDSTNLVQSGGVYSALKTANKAFTVNGAVNELDHTGVTGTSGTVKFTVNEDKSITVSANSYPVTLDSTTTFFFFGTNSAAVPNIFKGKKLVGCPSGGASGTYRIVIQEFSSTTPSGAVAESSDVGEGANISNGDYIRMYIRLGSGYQLTSALTFKPMISLPELGLSYDDYVPYAKSNKELTEDGTTTKSQMSILNSDLTASLNTLVKKNGIVDLTLTVTVSGALNEWTNFVQIPDGFIPSETLQVVPYLYDNNASPHERIVICSIRNDGYIQIGGALLSGIIIIHATYISS